jgi:hypothetical protein
MPFTWDRKFEFPQLQRSADSDFYLKNCKYGPNLTEKVFSDMFLHIQWVETSYILMIEPYSRVVPLLSLDPCVMTLITDFEIADEQDDSRSRCRHFFTPPYHSGSTDILQFRIFLNALPQSSKSWFLGKLRLKGTGVVTNSL